MDNRQNRGQMKAKRNAKRAQIAVHRADRPHQRAAINERVAINWTAPMHPGEFAHVLNVFQQAGQTILTVCLENRKHIRFTLPLSDCRLTQHHA